MLLFVGFFSFWILDSSVGSALSAELRVRILPDKLELSQLKAILKIACLLFITVF